jgi:hypothetical protein
MLTQGADILFQNYIPDVKLSLYHTLIIVLQGLMIFSHINECGVTPFFYQNGI